MKTKGPYPFREREEFYADFTPARLAYALQDAKGVISVWPDHPNYGWYADDIHTLAKLLRDKMTRLEA